MEHAKTPSKLSQILRYGVIAILILLPFHALFTIWLGSTFGNLDLFRIWKELLIALMVPTALWLVYKDRQLREWFTGTHPKSHFRSEAAHRRAKTVPDTAGIPDRYVEDGRGGLQPLVWRYSRKRTFGMGSNSRIVLLVLLYILLHMLLGIIALAANEVNREALIYALLINLRFPVFLLLVVVVSAKTDLKKHWRALLLWPAAVVITFGLMQQFILPPDFLGHFGYGPDTIPAVQTVDQKKEFQRIQSTLRGANPLGAYLVLIVTALAASVLLKGPKPLAANRQLLTIAAALLALFLTYSRSAWLGAFASLACLGFWKIRRDQRRFLLISAAVFVVMFAGTVWLLRDNDRVQNAVFHSDETSQSSESSNAARGRHLVEGVQSVASQPLGRGPGTAGPASVRNEHLPRIAENYYIQIAQEVGLLGLALFIAINVLVAQRLWLQRRDTLSQILLASLIGLTLINMLSHAWTDDTLSLLWWGLAGIALSSTFLSHRTSKT